MRNVELDSPTEIFDLLKEGVTYVNCFNGTTGRVKKKNKGNYYITLDNGYECHILNVKEVY